MNDILEISGVIICQDEEDYILNAIRNIYSYVDELIILDGGSSDNTLDLIAKFKYETNEDKIRVFRNNFTGHFGHQKNVAISKVHGVWTLNLDADEVFEDEFLKNIRKYTRQNDYEVYAFPRVNLIDGKQTDVYPDYQLRLFRSFCVFGGAVHEELVNWHHDKEFKFQDKGYRIIHSKTLKRQEFQDRQYLKLSKKYKNFMKFEIIQND